MIKSIQNNIYFLKNIVCYSKAYVIGEAFVAVIEQPDQTGCREKGLI